MKRGIPFVLLFACCCACARREAVIVGSKNFTEQLLLGEIAAQQLERKLHIRVGRALGLGGTLLAHEAILKGDIDLYPEYTGTAGGVILKQKIPDDPVRAYMAIKDAYFDRFHLIWLPPLGFNDTFAMVVRREDAKRLSAPDLSAAVQRPWRLGVFYEFVTRPDGLRSLNQVYNLRWNGTPQSMDLGLLYEALRQRKIDMAAGDSTDAALTRPEFVTLADDKKAFPPYTACFVIRVNVIRDQPAVKWALTMLENRISDDVMRDLNRQVDVEHQPIVKVARDFLASQP